MEGEDRGDTPEPAGKARHQDHQPALPTVPICMQMKDRGAVGQGQELPEQTQPAAGMMIVLARARLAVQIEYLDT